MIHVSSLIPKLRRLMPTVPAGGLQVAVKAILTNSRREVLLLRRSTEDDYLPSFWETPGGRMRVGESPDDALRRELQEETGLEAEILEPIAVWDSQLEKKNSHLVGITFRCRVTQITGLRLSREHDAHIWADPETLDSLLMTPSLKRELVRIFIKLREHA